VQAGTWVTFQSEHVGDAFQVEIGDPIPGSFLNSSITPTEAFPCTWHGQDHGSGHGHDHGDDRRSRFPGFDDRL
jgi:hypothetical protein